MNGNAEDTNLVQSSFYFHEMDRNISVDSTSSESHDKEDDMYVMVKFLGRGAFGTVNLYKNTADNSLVVWKEIDLKRLNSKMRSEAFAEVEILAMLFHPNIISYFKHFIGDDTLYIELEYAKGGNLANLINQQLNSNSYFNEETVLWYFYQLTSAIEYIHEIGIMHRDIKTLNIFFMQSGLLKLGDFGIAKILDSKMDLAETQVGTPLYMSPEIIEGKKYSNKTDLWALGCVMYEICTLTRVFDATNQLKLAYRISLCEVLPIDNDKYSLDLKTLIQLILSKEPDERPSAKQILSHPLFNERTDEFNSKINKLNVSTQKRQLSATNVTQKIIASKTFECFVWGGGKLIPKPIETFTDTHAPYQVSLGPTHYAIITLEKELFTWASAQGETKFSSAKLGHDKAYSRSPKQVEALSGISIEQVSCGDDFTLCLATSGELYTFGTDYMGCLGLGGDTKVLDENQSIYIPVRIPFFERNSLKVVKISCGELHSIALTESNQVFTWGCGEYGRLGHNDEDEREEPTELKFKLKYAFKDVFAGSDCSFLLTKDGAVLAFGNNEHNKLCLNEAAATGFRNKCKKIQGVTFYQQLTPKVVKKLSQYHVIKVCPGKTHTAVIDLYGRLFTFGNNKYGELGLGDFKEHTGLNMVTGILTGQHIINAACGDTFTICATSENQIFSWGNRKNGRLGIDSDVNSDVNSVAKPKPIFGSLHLVSDMNACYWNSIIIAERVINTKPVRSISYMEYLRNRDTISTATPSELVQYDPNFTPDSSTGLVENRFENFNFGSPPASFDRNDSTNENSSETPEWLKADIANMDFIPIDALQGEKRDRMDKVSELDEQNEIELSQHQTDDVENKEEREENYNTIQEALEIIKNLRKKVAELESINKRLIEEKSQTRIEDNHV